MEEDRRAMGDEQGFDGRKRLNDEKLRIMFAFLSTEHSGGGKKKNNVLPHYGNDSMNLNPLILTNIQSSVYFKGEFWQIFATFPNWILRSLFRLVYAPSRYVSS